MKFYLINFQTTQTCKNFNSIIFSSFAGWHLQICRWVLILTDNCISFITLEFLHQCLCLFNTFLIYLQSLLINTGHKTTEFTIIWWWFILNRILELVIFMFFTFYFYFFSLNLTNYFQGLNSLLLFTWTLLDRIFLNSISISDL